MADLQITFCLFSWPNCYFCHCMFKFFQSLTLELCICDSGEAYETIAFLQTRGRQMTWKEVSFLGRPYRVLPGYNRRTYIIFWLEVYIVVQLLSCVWLFATPWTAPHQASLSFTISRSLLRLTSIGDAIQPSHSLSSPSPPAFSLSQHQGLFQLVSSSHQVPKVLEFQLQYQYFQWIFRTYFF